MAYHKQFTLEMSWVFVNTSEVFLNWLYPQGEYIKASSFDIWNTALLNIFLGTYGCGIFGIIWVFRSGGSLFQPRWFKNGANSRFFIAFT